MIELKNISKLYDDGFQALRDINLMFEDGKINVLIGPSGCGKTTTLKLLNRLVDYTGGQIIIDNKDIRQMNSIELRRNLGFVIQNIGLFPHMTIYNNVASVPKLLKWNKQKIRHRVIELLELVNLEPETYMHRKPSELSGGQQQRIGVIRALAADPSTILMDEPFSALDPISREQIQDELIRLQEEINKTIIFVTHDMDEAIKIADNIILMKDGEIVQKGSPHELLTNPANAFVKDFIGEKHLDMHRTLPPLSEFVYEDFVSISSDSSVASAIDQMIAHKIPGISLVDNNGTYLGQLSLYKALSNKERTLQDVLDLSIKPVREDEDIRSVINHVTATEETVPVIAEDQKLIGTLDINKLFHTLCSSINGKRGDV
ncbi:ATP-binding cassette domain-containing protein [Salicibibacter halophilus]|uniref:Quaternary amine transport ATP-binding protein n=1 Tax=Salicibibacter halophilus TaxID=2502791 RepID=A0A514LEY6_9BACI|nr:betaine/proline/choline family ABC transporter ATP-binding protein [Salicibibacter halophilus]QDI90416.1 ATP-binding cassette domain-containing protein [Salicibibacter halophilus]